jgi:hypothetical protein
MKKQLKTKLVLTHVVEYYTKNVLIKADTIAEVTKDGMRDYWKRVVEQCMNADNGCVELENYSVVTKCVRDYDYSVQRIIERVIIDDNN